MTLLVVTPLQKELDALAHALQQHGLAHEDTQIGRLAAHRFVDLDVVVARGGLGKTQFGIQTQHLIEHSASVEAVACCGAAGALDSALAVGDVVVATETVEHDFTARFVSRPLPRFAGDPALLEALQRLPRAAAFHVHFGIVASGDEDIIEIERGLALRQATEACAVAWEGAGGARACAFSNVLFVELRGITDTADHDAPSDFRANLGVAMTNIATLIAQWRGGRAY